MRYDVAISNILKINLAYIARPDYKNNKEDVTGNIKREIQAIKGKIKIEYTKAITYSSSKLINIFSDNYNDSKKVLNLINQT